MTHDELLERIKIPYVAIGGFSWQIEQALRAVVELHKPVELISSSMCLECSSDEETVGYPCPTIKAIEKELQ
jgi:hypothetical protein